MDANPIPDVAPKSASAYLDPRYWDERFSAEEHYEWLKDYSHFQHLLRLHLPPADSVLEIGCGNSRLAEELYNDGVADITCIDISAVAVDRMRNRLAAQGLQGIKVLEADMLDLPFPGECFDVVIEKGTMKDNSVHEAQSLRGTEEDQLYAALLPTEAISRFESVTSRIHGGQPLPLCQGHHHGDVLFVDSGSPWNPNPAAVNKVMKMLEGVHKVLKPDGIFISISFGQPHFRRPLFESPGFTWSVSWSTFGDGFHYFFYTLKKGKSFDRGVSCERLSIPTMNMFHEELEGEDFIFRTTVDEA